MKLFNKSAFIGYSILEVLIAVWLLVFVGGSLIATFAYLAKSSSVSADRASAELLADELLERSAKIGPPDWGLDGLSGTRSVEVEVGGASKFDWSLQPHDLGDSGLGNLYKLDLRIDWRVHQDGVERGRRALVRTRHVYLERF